MPGETQRRTIRVRHAARSLANVACGGQPLGDLDSTASRFNQARFADLDLIAEKGLVEVRGGSDKSAEKVELGECVDEEMPSYLDWYQLAEPWSDVLRDAVQSSTVVSTKPDVAACLTSTAQVPEIRNLDPSDPTASFLAHVVDSHMASLDDASQFQDEMMQLSDTFVTCTRPYFEALEKELTPRQDALVERNRELLQRFAAELTRAGYVP